MKNRPIYNGGIAIVLLFFVIPFTLFAQDDEKSLEELKKMRDELKGTIEQLHKEIEQSKEKKNGEDKNFDEIDRIRDEIQKINKSISEELAELEEKINEERTDSNQEAQEEFDDEIEELREEIKDARNSLDEEFEELHEDIEEVKENIEEELEEIKEEAEEDKHSGSFVFCPRLTWLDKEPLKLLKKSDGNLSDKVFSFNNNKAFMLGFMNYYSIENNFRIGTDIACGYKQFECNPYQSTVMDTVLTTTGAVDSIIPLTVDSIISLHVIPAHIGFICEKVFRFVKWDIFTGFMIGGGALVVIKNNKLYKVNNIFIDGNYSDTTTQNNLSAVVAPSFNWDIHAGTAVEIAPKFYVGMDCAVNFSYAHNGFNGRTKDFVSINPAIRLRLSVGGAG